MKIESRAGFSGPHLELFAASEAATRAIPPLWPLSSSVAVNPFLGQAEQSLSEVAARLGRVSGTAVTMPRAWYITRIDSGEITDTDLQAALDAAPDGAPGDVAALIAALKSPEPAPGALPTIADLAAEVSGIDWPALIAERFGAWAAGYFDTGQALWQVTPGQAAFTNWRNFASRDLTPEIIGLAGFAACVDATPQTARAALALSCDALQLTGEAAQTYFHQLLLGLGGWSQLARWRLWQAELAGETDGTVTDLLAIRLIWEQALLTQYGSRINARWAEVRTAHAEPVAASDAQIVNAVVQEAAERAGQRRLGATLAGASAEPLHARPKLQAAFCIDVRSEVFRRALESLDPGIQTVGFAGFFGLTASHQGFASDVTELRLPVLLNPGFHSHSGDETTAEADRAARFSARARRAWGRFKLAAVSSFAFVEATGPVYLGKLVKDALGMIEAPAPSTVIPRFDGEMAPDDRIAAAAGILNAMSMTRDFAPLVLMLGHGANVVNNPHASALHCGACGGYSGEVNARLLAGLLNDPAVRKGLVAKDITVPADTVFVAGLHDTTTDAVTLYTSDGHSVPAEGLRSAKDWLGAAGKIARTERALRLPRADGGNKVEQRSRDWAETRPEWALAGCSAFIAAPRPRTRGKALDGRAFLHDYNWQRDEGFGVLELIMTAPVVVASWISLQYYGSVVAPEVFGAGNKLLHNVTGGMGVVEGNGGVLRGGLPWQSVHDGTGFAHDPLRLTVCIEAPEEAITDVLRRHPGVAALFDNRWLHLLRLDGSGQIAGRYVGGLTWEAVVKPARLAA